jgi:TfoX/Sxy family transcriptional regulator of competence genes
MKKGPAGWSEAPPELIDAFGAALAELPDAVPRPMFGYPAGFARGQLFTGLFEDRWFVRLPDDDRVELAAAGGLPFEPMPGRSMREYLTLPPDLVADPAARRAWLDRSLRYAASLPPKPRR